MRRIKEPHYYLSEKGTQEHKREKIIPINLNNYFDDLLITLHFIFRFCIYSFHDNQYTCLVWK